MAHPKTHDPRFTYGDYIQWTGDDRWELIDGAARMMSPAPGRWHQDVVLGIGAQARVQLRGGPCRAFVAPFDVRLPATDEDDAMVDTVVQPDVAVLCDTTKLDAAGARGAPEWIVEVLSPATTSHDRLTKRDLYELHGVREYWIVDPIERDLWIYRLKADGLYGEPETRIAEGRTAVDAVADLVVDWSFVFDE